MLKLSNHSNISSRNNVTEVIIVTFAATVILPHGDLFGVWNV